MRFISWLGVLGVAGFGFYSLAYSDTPTLNYIYNKGYFSYEVKDAATGELIPCKLTFISNSVFLQLSKKDMATGDKATAAYHQVYSSTGKGKVRLPPGDLDIYISRGPEWDIALLKKQKVVLGETKEIKAELHHVIDSTGWISGDFHVHADPSPDSVVSLRDRLYQLSAEGLMMVGSADHQDVTDYAPEIAAAGLTNVITSAPGEEMSAGGWGHFGVFPLERVPGVKGHGAIKSKGKTLDEIFEDIRTNHPEAVLTVHHPRLDNRISYFNLSGFQSATDSAKKSGFRLDFDAMEVVNGYRNAEPKTIERLIQDWFNLIAHGHLVTGLGNSDTHYLVKNIGGYPRNYMYVGEAELKDVTPLQVAKAIKEHHVFFTNGPFLRMNVEGADIGDLVAAPQGKAKLSITVEAAPWVSVSKVTLYVNGKVSQTWELSPTTEVKRLQQIVSLTMTQDSFVVLRAEGDKLMSPIYGDPVTYKVYPFGMTNPIFFDVNSNGRFDGALAKAKE